MTISFSVMTLVIESKEQGERYPVPSVSSFSGLAKSATHLHNGTYYDFHSEITTDYVWIYVNHGKSSPRNAELTNIQTGEKTPNLRTLEEAELTKQTFAFYDFKRKLFYLSNGKMKAILESVLSEQLSTSVVLRPVYVSAEEFIAQLKEVDSISFSHVNHLFSQNNVQRQALVDLTGVDAPDNFTIQAKYKTHRIVNFIRQLLQAKTNNEIHGLTVTGRDNDNFAIVYNTDTFTRKVELLVNVNPESNMFDADEVLDLIISYVNHEG